MSEWIKWPENEARNWELYFVTITNGDKPVRRVQTTIARKEPSRWVDCEDESELDDWPVIAFAEIKCPEPYKEEGNG